MTLLLTAFITQAHALSGLFPATSLAPGPNYLGGEVVNLPLKKETGFLLP